MGRHVHRLGTRVLTWLGVPEDPSTSAELAAADLEVCWLWPECPRHCRLGLVKVSDVVRVLRTGDSPSVCLELQRLAELAQSVATVTSAGEVRSVTDDRQQ